MKQIIRGSFIAALTFFTAVFVVFGFRSISHVYLVAARNNALIALVVLLLYLILLRKRIGFFENMLHELTHMLFSLLTFKKVSGLYVSATNGAVYTEGSRSMLVTLSPYFFPLLTAVLLVLTRIIKVEYHSQLLIASYTLSMTISIKHLIKDPNEMLSTGPGGCFLLLILNFWISYLLLLWITSGSLNLNEILTTIYDGIKRIIS